MTSLKWLLITCCAICSLSTLATEKQNTLKYNISSSGSHYPYYTNNPDHPGVLPEIIEKVLVDANISAYHEPLPTKRITKYLNEGIIDFDVISLNWLPQSERNNTMYVFSDPLITVTEMLVTLPENSSKWKNISNLTGKNVGTVLGYYYHSDDSFNRVDFPSEKELMEALVRKRVDVAIISKLPALYWSQQLNLSMGFGAQYSHGFLRIRLLSKHKHLLPVINKTIKNLHGNGYITNAAKKYMQDIPTQN